MCRNEATRPNRAQAQVHPGPPTWCCAVKGVGGGALSSLPVDDLRGASAEGIRAHHHLTFWLWGETQHMSASVVRGIRLILGAALKQTVETPER